MSLEKCVMPMKPDCLVKFYLNITLSFKNESCSSGEKSKNRLTVMLCVNLIGERQKPLIILVKCKKTPLF